VSRTTRIARLILVCCLLFPALSAAPQTFQGDNQRTGRTADILRVEPNLLWSYQAENSIHASPVIGAEGTVFLAGADGRLRALSRQGDLMWEFQAQESLYGTPAVGGDGTVYFADLAGHYYAVRGDGSLKWSLELPGAADRRVVASATVADDGTSYVVSWDDRLHAIRSDGTLRWSAPLAGQASATPVLDAQGNIYVVSLDRERRDRVAISKFAPDSSNPVWVSLQSLGVDRNRVIASPAIDLARNRVYMAASRLTDGVLWAIRLSDGQPLFEKVFPKGILSSPAVGHTGNVYLGCLDGKVYALAPEEGAIRWTFAVDGYYVFGSPVVDGAENVYIGDSDGTVYALSYQGRELWRFSTEASIYSSPVVEEDRAYVTSFDSRLYALSAQGAPVQYFSQAADGVADGKRLKTSLLISTPGESDLFTLESFDSEGQPIRLLPGVPAASSHRVEAGEAVRLRTQGDDELQVGYWRVTSGKGIGGAALFEYSEQGTVMYEAAVPAAFPLKDFTVLADYRGNRETGLAVVNSEAVPTLVVFRLYDRAFEPVAGREVELPAGGHYARYVSQIFPAIVGSSFELGSVTVESRAPLGAVTLTQHDDPALYFPEDVPTTSAFPVGPGRAETAAAEGSSPKVFYFPQIGCGTEGDTSLRTELFFINTGEAGSIRVEFFESEGQALFLPLEGLAPASVIERAVGRGEVVTLATAPVAGLRIGYAKVTASAGVTGNAIFGMVHRGVVLFETGVPATEASAGQRLFIEFEGAGRDTALAVVNLGADRAVLELELLGEGGEVLEAGIQMPARGHRALYVSELFPAIRERETPTRGILAIKADQDLAVLSLLQESNPELFPSQVYRLTALPSVGASTAENTENAEL
jgi:outer membrane protein assembly factor BamB